MGWFDFFRRKPAEPKLDFAALQRMAGQPRCHHYTLAHYALRSVAFQDPVTFVGLLPSPEGVPFLTRLLAQVTETCKDRERRPGFAAADIVVHPVRVGNYPCAMIEMPEPRAVTEAYFAGAVLLADLEDGLPDRADAKLRYFTLEMGLTLGGPPRTVLCEWTAEGSHLNFGDGPPPTREAFAAAIAEKLNVA